MGQSKKARAGFKNRLGTKAPVVTLVRPKLTTKQCYHNKDCDDQCKKNCITEYCNDMI